MRWTSILRRRVVATRRPGGGLRHLGRLRRLELRSWSRWLGGSADRNVPHGGHVPLHGARPGRVVGGDLHCWGRLRVRPTGDGPLGRFPHWHGDPYRVRHRPRRDRQLHRRLCQLPHRHTRVDRLPRLLCRLRGLAPLRRRRSDAGDFRDHRDRSDHSRYLPHCGRPEVPRRQPDGYPAQWRRRCE